MKLIWTDNRICFKMHLSQSNWSSSLVHNSLDLQSEIKTQQKKSKADLTDWYTVVSPSFALSNLDWPTAVAGEADSVRSHNKMKPHLITNLIWYHTK